MKKNQVKKICIECNKEYSVKKSHENKSKFCSMNCLRLYWKKQKSKINKCLYCGKKCRVILSRDFKFCSKQCSGLYQRKRVEKLCLLCHKPFEITPHVKDTKFCSMKCYGLYQRKRIERICKFCGKKFEIKISTIEKGKKNGIEIGIYCSRKCRWQCPENKRKHKLISQTLRDVFPNKLEIRLNSIIQDLNLPYKYVGNGEVWIAGLNPDFINTNSQKKIIELFGEPWHKEGFMKNHNISYFATEQGRKDIFNRYGYDTLVIWSKELKNIDNVKQRLLDFEKSPHIG